MRLDYGFYSKEVLASNNMINRKKYKYFGELIDVLTDYTSNGSFASLAKNVTVFEKEEYAKWIRIQNLDDMDYIKNIKYVNKESYEFLKKSKLIGNELLISKTGEYLGKAYLFRNEENKKCTLADNIFLIRLKKQELQNFIYIFINSTIGRNMILRWNQGTGQSTIIKESLRNIKIPILEEKLLEKINRIVEISFNNIKGYKELYNAANNILKENIINLKDIENTNINIKKKSETFDISGRIDAEYYQTKYDILIKKLKAMNNDILCNLVLKKKSIEPGSEYYRNEGVPFIRVSNLFSQKITKPEIFLNPEEFKNIEQLYPTKDTILLSKDGSIGIAYKVEEDMKAVTSGAILHLRVKNIKQILPDYLTLVLNSEIVRVQAERDSNGAIIQHWKPSEIDNVIIPILDFEKQKEISDKVKEAFKLKHQSEKLLEIAKESIKIAIEENEDKAILYIEENLNEQNL